VKGCLRSLKKTRDRHISKHSSLTLQLAIQDGTASSNGAKRGRGLIFSLSFLSKRETRKEENQESKKRGFPTMKKNSAGVLSVKEE